MMDDIIAQDGPRITTIENAVVLNAARVMTRPSSMPHLVKLLESVVEFGHTHDAFGHDLTLAVFFGHVRTPEQTAEFAIKELVGLLATSFFGWDKLYWTGVRSIELPNNKELVCTWAKACNLIRCPGCERELRYWSNGDIECPADANAMRSAISRLAVPHRYFNGYDLDVLLKMRDELDTAIYDLERQRA